MPGSCLAVLLPPKGLREHGVFYPRAGIQRFQLLERPRSSIRAIGETMGLVLVAASATHRCPAPSFQSGCVGEQRDPILHVCSPRLLTSDELKVAICKELTTRRFTGKSKALNETQKVTPIKGSRLSG